MPPTNGSGVRLFNLSPDTTSATLDQFGKPVATASNINYGVGSPWVPVASAKPLSSTVTDAVSGKSIATDITTPPAAPAVFTLWLIGNQSAASWEVSSGAGGAYSARAPSLDDSPHNVNGLELCPSAAPSPPPPPF